MRTASSTRILLPLLLLALTACGGGEAEEEKDQLAGPCIINSSEPSLIISSVQDSVSAAPIPTVTLTNVTVDGRPFDPTYSLARNKSNIRVVGNALECTVPCGFSESEAAMSFTVSAPGYSPRVVTGNGAYATRRGGCPLDLSDGNRVSVVLTPSP